MTTLRSSLALLALLVAMAITGDAIGDYIIYRGMDIPGPWAPTRVGLQLAPAPGDSIGIALEWTAVTDALGDPIDEYHWTIERQTPGTPIDLASGTVDGDVLADTVIIERPAFGDTAAIRGAVYATDTYGIDGAVGASPWLLITRANPGPTAPIITVDTIAASTVDSVRLHLVDAADSIIQVGELAEVCATVYAGTARYYGVECDRLARPAIYRGLRRGGHTVEADQQ